MLNHVRDLVLEENAARFPTPPGQRTNPGGQAKIAEQMNMSQATLNTCFVSGSKRFSIGVILGIHAYFAKSGRPMSLDAMLRLPTARFVEPAEGVARSSAAIEQRLHSLEAEVDKLRDEQQRVAATAIAADRSRIRNRR